VGVACGWQTTAEEESTATATANQKRSNNQPSAIACSKTTPRSNSSDIGHCERWQWQEQQQHHQQEHCAAMQ